MSSSSADPALINEPLAVAFETGDQTVVPIAEALLREIEVPFTWKDIGLSAARQGGGYQLYGAALYQLLVRQSDLPDASLALEPLLAEREDSQIADSEDDERPVTFQRRRIARWGIGLYLGGIALILVVLGAAGLAKLASTIVSRLGF